jgi:hypothetical protein
MHTFTCATSTFFVPALATGLWALAVKKRLTQTLHVLTALYLIKRAVGQHELFTSIVTNFFVSQATWTHSANGASF